MRIIAGKWRSCRLVRPETPGTRPPPDRVKETIFNVLGHHYGTLGALPPLAVADVFAGSGAFGLEALSRGAARCIFFEQGRDALAALRQNIAALHAEADAKLVTSDAWRSATEMPAEAPYQLLFLDPPYRDSQDASPHGRVCDFLARVPASPYGTLIVLHHAVEVDWAKAATPPWSVFDARHIGSNGVTIFAR